MHPRLQLTHGIGVITGDFEIVDACRAQVHLRGDDLEGPAGDGSHPVARLQAASVGPVAARLLESQPGRPAPRARYTAEA